MKTVKIKSSFILVVFVILFSCKYNTEKVNLIQKKRSKQDYSFKTIIYKDLDKNGKLDTIKIINSEDKSLSQILIILDNKKTKKYSFPVNSYIDERQSYNFVFFSDYLEKIEKSRRNPFDFGVSIGICNSGCGGEYLFSFKNNQLILNSFLYERWQSRLWSPDQKRAVNIEEDIERSVRLDTILPNVFDSKFLIDVIEEYKPDTSKVLGDRDEIKIYQKYPNCKIIETQVDFVNADNELDIVVTIEQEFIINNKKEMFFKKLYLIHNEHSTQGTYYDIYDNKNEK